MSLMLTIYVSVKTIKRGWCNFLWPSQKSWTLSCQQPILNSEPTNYFHDLWVYFIGIQIGIFFCKINTYLAFIFVYLDLNWECQPRRKYYSWNQNNIRIFRILSKPSLKTPSFGSILAVRLKNIFFFRNKTFLFFNFSLKLNFVKPHKISTYLAYSDNCYFHLFLSVVWLSWNFARFHEIQFQTEPKSFSFLSWKTKKFYS